MIIIGLTGGIGSGKSEVSRILKELGAEIIDADKVGHEAYVPHSETWEIVVATFGRDILGPDSEIDRKKLGAMVFNDPAARRKLNNIMHPQMRKMMENRIYELQDQGATVAVLDAAVLIEADWLPLVNEVWVTTAPEAQIIQRLQLRNGIDAEEIKRRINAQMASEDRLRYADAIIDNSGNWAELHRVTQALWESRIEKRTEN